MIFRQTHKTVKKKIYRGKHEDKKEISLYRVFTYWFLLVPIYTRYELIE